jgi:hypothetical protein
MTPGERNFKLSITIIFTVPLVIFGVNPISSLIVAHGLNFLINGQLPVLLRYVVSDIGLTREKVERALAKIKRNAKAWGAVDILVFGSFSRFCMKSTSDLDIRLYHRPGFLDSLMAYSYAVVLRVWANVNFIPLDIYCFSDPNFLNRMREDEVPALLLGSSEMLSRYPSTLNVEEMLEKNAGLK